MAEQEIILEINIQDSLAKTAELRGAIDDLIAQRQALAELSKKGDEEAAKALEGVNAAVRNLQQEYRTQTKIIDGYVAAKKSEANVTDFAKNSIQQNRDLLKQLTAQYINLKNPSQQATNQIKELTKTLKQQEAAIGDTRRNVGNYKESILSALGSVNVFGKNIGGIIDPLKNMGAAFGSAGNGAAGFSAILLGGIPIILAGLQGLVSVMQKFDSVTEGLEDTMQGLNFSFDYFISHGNDGSFTDLINNMGKAYDEGVKLSQVMRQLAEAQDFQRVVDAQANKEIEALIIKSKDRTRTEQERIAFLDEASRKEEAALKRSLELAEQRVALAQQEFKRVIESGLADDKAKKSLNDANVAFIDLQRESGNLQEKILNRRNALLEEISKSEEARNTKRLAELKKIQDEEDKIAELNLKNEQQIVIEQGKLEEQRLKNQQAEFDASNKQKQENYNKQLQMQSETAAAFLKKESETKAEEVRITKEAEAEKIQIQQASLQASQTLSGALIGLIQNVADATGASAEFNRAMAFVQIGVQTAIGLASGIAQAASVPWPANIAAIASIIGTVLGAIGSAVAILNDTPSTPKRNFATGVIGLDGEGTETSDSIPAYLSKGESVLTAKATKRFHRELAFMEYAVGNSPNYQFGKGKFATGFIPEIPTVSDGGFSQRANRQDNTMALMMQEAIKAGFALAPAPKLSIVELESKQASRNRSVRVSEA